MQLRLTKTNAIVFSVAILVLSGALGYLIWRVNQEDTTAPTDSEAASCDPACPSSCNCHTGFGICVGSSGCADYSGCTSDSDCSSGFSCHQGFCCDKCEDGGDGDVDSCTYGSDCTNKCYWPETAYCTRSGTCTCMTVAEQQNDPTWNPCTDSSPKCTPTCDPGDTTAECSARCSSCNNLYYVKTTCPYCGDGKVNDDEECDPPGSSCTKSGKSGTCSSSCTCTINPYCGDGKKDAGEECDPKATPTGCPAGSTCSNSCVCNVNPFCGDGKKDPGESCDPKASPTGCNTGEECLDDCTCSAVIEAICGDGILGNTPGEQCEQGDPSGVECSWNACDQSTCKCLPPGLNISKSVVEVCIDESTENPTSQLTYTITISNTGAGTGQISKIEDVLDSKVVSAGLTPTSITPPGVYSNGKILWNFSPALSLPAGETKTYTYKISVDKNNFGVYDNTVTLTPVLGDTISDTAQIDADCIITTPQTGIFDTTLGRMIVGILLVLFGGIVYNIPAGIFIFDRKERKFKYRIRFESRISNK